MSISIMNDNSLTEDEKTDLLKRLDGFTVLYEFAYYDPEERRFIKVRTGKILHEKDEVTRHWKDINEEYLFEPTAENLEKYGIYEYEA